VLTEIVVEPVFYDGPLLEPVLGVRRKHVGGFFAEREFFDAYSVVEFGPVMSESVGGNFPL
jgi:hypothetical protein